MSEAKGAIRTPFIDPRGMRRRLQAADFTVLFIATMVVFLGSSLSIPAHAVPIIGFLGLEVAFAGVLTMSWIGLYELDLLLDPRRGILSAVAASTALGAIVFLVTHLGLFALEPWWLSGWMSVCVAHFTLTRMGAYLWASRKAAAGRFRQRVAVVGWGADAEEALRLLEDADPVRIEVVGRYDERHRRADAGSATGPLADLLAAAQRGSVDLVVVAIPFSVEQRLLQTLKQLWPLPVDIRISGEASQLKLNPRAYGYLGKLPLLSVFDRPLRRRGRAKDLLDRGLAALLLAMLLPVTLLAAAAIRLESRGPVLVKEQCRGFDGAPMALYRFRCGGVTPTTAGGALRKLKLESLPRLLNVLKGDLSLVGPRLDSPGADPEGSLYRQVIYGYFSRHGIKPGVTGWAQINGWTQGVAATEKTVRHDLEYVDRWSLFFDLYILFKAPFALLRKGAAG